MSTPAPFERIDDHSLAGAMSGTVEATAFWAAVAIPLAYPPLLYAGLDGTAAYAFVGLLLANAVALALGHDYAADE